MYENLPDLKIMLREKQRKCPKTDKNHIEKTH